MQQITYHPHYIHITEVPTFHMFTLHQCSHSMTTVTSAHSSHPDLEDFCHTDLPFHSLSLTFRRPSLQQLHDQQRTSRGAGGGSICCCSTWPKKQLKFARNRRLEKCEEAMMVQARNDGSSAGSPLLWETSVCSACLCI